MATVRVRPENVGRLAPVRLAEVPLDGKTAGNTFGRRLASRALREARWEHDLRPDIGYSPPQKLRDDCLIEAAMLEYAAVHPSDRQYLLPEAAIKKVLGGR